MPSPRRRSRRRNSAVIPSPQFLPDGRHFLFFVTGSAAARGVYLGELDRPETQAACSTRMRRRRYAAPGHLLFVRDGKLQAQGFDPDRRSSAARPVSD